MGKKSDSEKIQFYQSAPESLQSRAGLHDPSDWFREMRNSAPVQYDERRNVYDVFSYQHVKEGLQNGEGLARKSLSQDGPRSSTPFSYIDNAIVWMDGSDHKQTKGPFFQYFRPDRLSESRDMIRQIAEDQIRLALEDGPEFDFVSDYATPVPLRVIMSMVGVPQGEQERVLDWLLTFRDVTYSEFSGFDSERPSQMAEAVEYFEQLVARRRRDPRDDLISQLIEDTELTHETIGANCFNFILAGQGTLTALLSNALYLFEERGLLGQLHRYDLEVVLEEVLRYRAPLQSRARTTTQPITIGGTKIPEGKTVILWIGSANRDAEQFERPESFLPRRDPDHLSFGNGPHTCIGAPLARLEAPVALQTFFDRFDRIDVLDSHQPTAKPSELGFERLPIATDPV